MAGFGRHLVRRQQGGHQLDRMRLGGAADGAQLLELAVQRQAIAALRLGGGGAPGEHQVEAPADLARPLFFAGPPGGRDRRRDAAPPDGVPPAGPPRPPGGELVPPASRPTASASRGIASPAVAERSARPLSACSGKSRTCPNLSPARSSSTASGSSRHSR